MQKPPKKASTNSLVTTVGVDAEAFRLLAAQAKRLKLSKRKFTSAAIAYFAKNGLDPTNSQLSLTGLSMLVDENGVKGRELSNQIGNMFMTIIGRLEPALYGFMQQQQQTTQSYLQQIEHNLLAQQAAMEATFLVPLLEQVVRGGLDAEKARLVITKILFKLYDSKQVMEDADARTRENTIEREERVVKELNKILLRTASTAPQVTAQPQPVKPPQSSFLKVKTPVPGPPSSPVK